jgi:arylsulfatase A-like enzyme
MKAIMVMFDSLNRNMLQPYGGDYIKAPNFERLAEKTVTFRNFYSGSMPCMPARRELHTGRYNFLHRSWGPIEAFDFSTPEFLKKNGVYTHIVTDHQHYWEDGGEGYLPRYSSFDCIRGQEGDYWIGQVDRTKDVEDLSTKNNGCSPSKLKVQDKINRKQMKTEEKHPMFRVHKGGMNFIERNKDADNWFLQIEHFDPHEPFFAPEKYKNLYNNKKYSGEEFDWPNYKVVSEDENMISRAKENYAALVSMCDHYLGQILDTMDRNDLWKDTMLIVNTDHGFLLGEHEWWGKNCMPIYNELANLPFFIWDPRSGKRGEEREALAQTIDIAPTLLDFFNLPANDHMDGKSLSETIYRDKPVREAALFGNHGGHINITDGSYVYMRAGESTDCLYQYTLAATHLRQFFLPEELSNIELSNGFSFTDNKPVMKIKRADDLTFSFAADTSYFGHRLYDLKNDPEQKNPIDDSSIEAEMIKKMAVLMEENEAPKEQYQRMGIPLDGDISVNDLNEEKIRWRRMVEPFKHVEWKDNTQDEYLSILQSLPIEEREKISSIFESYIKENGCRELDSDILLDFIKSNISNPYLEKVMYFCEIAGRRV